MISRGDTLMLRLIWRQWLNALLATRASTRFQLLALGGFFLAYFVADIAVALRGAAESLRRLDSLWLYGLPVAAILLGGATGALTATATAAQAQASFLLALPLSDEMRRRAAALAAFVLTLPAAAVCGLAIGAACAVVGESNALARACAAFALFVAGGAVSIFLRLSLRKEEGATEKPARSSGTPKNLFRLLDRRRPARLGLWSWGLAPGRLVLSACVVLVVIAVLASGASLQQRLAAPAVLAGLAGGLSLFMLTLRCAPLASPVLRATPLGFFQAWRALLRIPSALAVAFYAGPAAAAVLAEPQALAMPIGAAFILLALCAGYAVFAAFYGRRPGLAALSYCAAMFYAAFESSEYGRPILLACLAMLALLWSRARGKYRHG